MSRRGLFATGGVLLVLLGGPVLAPSPDSALPAGPSWGLAAQGQAELTTVARGLAQAWARGADQVVASRLVQGQVRLHLDGTVSATLPNRQASAALREYLRGYDQGQVEVVRVSLADGAGERGFVELRWTVRRSGTSQALRRTVFLGLRHDGRNWLVDEVRVMH